MAMIFFDETLGGRIVGKKGEPTKVRVDFDELAVLHEGNKTHCFFWAIQTDAYALADKKLNKKWEGPNKAYLLIDGDSEEKGVKLVHEVLKPLEQGKVYKGFLQVDGGMMGVDKFLADPAQLAVISTMVLGAEEVEPGKLDPSTLVAPKPRGGGSWGSKAESTEERIKARMAAFKAIALNPESVTELKENLTLIMGKAPTNEQVIAAVWKLID